MKALLLCAGEGTRLRPITNNTPKPLVLINNKPLLEYWLENLEKVGVKEFLINTHYLHKKIENYVQNSKFKNKITLFYEKELLNTAGPIIANESFFNKKEPFLLVHTDNLSFCNFYDFLAAHKNRPQKTEITMMLFKSDTPKSCGIVKLNEKGIVETFYEKIEDPPSNLANGAVYICEYSILGYLKSLNKKEIDFSLEVIPNYLGRINTFLNDFYHKDIGTPEAYHQANKDILNII